MEDPEFPRRGRQPVSLGENPLFCKIFAENCMKMKKKLDREGSAGP